jgi:hypothetical protein
MIKTDSFIEFQTINWKLPNAGPTMTIKDKKKYPTVWTVVQLGGA